MMWGYPSTGGGMLLMTLQMVLWVAVLALIVWGVSRWLFGQVNHLPTPPTTSAIEALRHRYVRGEIDQATFEAMRTTLENTTPPPVTP